MPRKAAKKAKKTDPLRKRGVRGLTSRKISHWAAELKVLRWLLEEGSVKSAKLRALARPFPPRSLLKIARDSSGVAAREGRGGGITIADRAKVEQRAEYIALALDSLPDKRARRPVRRRAKRKPVGVEREPVVAPMLNADGRLAFPEGTWQADSIRFLAGRYSAQELVAFVPDDFAWAVQELLASSMYEDRPISAEEIAQWLVVLHGRDLLANAAELRHRIAVDLGMKRLERFHPGTAGARTFVQQAGLPPELAGSPGPERPPSITQIAAGHSLPPLADYQKSGKGEMAEVIRLGGVVIYCAPTGAGKTRTAWEAVADCIAALIALPNDGDRERNVVVWLAHRNELLDQACACFADVWRSLERPDAGPALLIRLWGRSTRDALSRIGNFDLPSHECVVLVSTPATMAALLAEDGRAPFLRQTILERCRLVVVDEAHRAAARSYRKIAAALRRPDRPAVAMIGLTATPFRDTYSTTKGEEETRELQKIFGRVIVPSELEPDPQRELVRRGVLARPIFQDVDTGVELDVDKRVRAILRLGGQLSASGEEAVDRALAIEALARGPERHAKIFEAVLGAARAPNARVLHFAESVASAQLMAVSLNNAGVPAAAISARTREGTRRRLIEEFRAGTIRVLCNCEVLTTGFDEPKVTHVVMARPTVSVVLYHQIVGRGLRGSRFGGTERCVIINCVDRVKIGPLVMADKAFQKVWKDSIDAGRALGGSGRGDDAHTYVHAVQRNAR